MKQKFNSSLRIHLIALIGVFCLNSFTLKSQTVDSLYHEAFKKNSKNQIENLIALAEIYLYENLDSCFSVLKKAQELSSQKGYENWLPEIYELLGIYHSKTGSLSIALKYTELAIEIKTKLEYPSDELADLYNNLGSIHLKSGRFKNALVNYQKALEIWNNLESPDAGKAILNIAAVYYAMNELEIAESFYYKAYDLFTESNNKKELASTYNHLGRLNLDRENYKEANSLFLKANAIYLDIKYKPGLATGINNLAILYYNQNLKKEALHNFKKALSIRKEIGDYHFIMESCFSIAAFYQFEDNYPEAIKYFREAYSYAQKNRSYSDLEETTGALSQAYGKLSICDSTAFYLDLSWSYKDSAYAEKIKTLKSGMNHFTLNMKNKPGMVFEKQELKDEITSLRDEISRQRIFYIATIIILLAVLGYVTIFRERKNNP